MVSSITNVLLDGDPFAPAGTDIIVQRGYLRVGLRVPEGWRALTGNQYESKVYRVAYRYEIDEENLNG
jgi:hypothetical protein